MITVSDRGCVQMSGIRKTKGRIVKRQSFEEVQEVGLEPTQPIKAKGF